uniref:Uncharacterized protein n=1 Tax=Rhizophagus irregularis (strain DAOM 181602 / DAOM 197198 / MUCL 43194) TaxID=747089 RepID=U9U6L6_RHIID
MNTLITYYCFLLWLFLKNAESPSCKPIINNSNKQLNEFLRKHKPPTTAQKKEICLKKVLFHLQKYSYMINDLPIIRYDMQIFR